MTRDLTWEFLLGIKPELNELLQAARVVRSTRSHFCANSYWLYNPRGLSYKQVLEQWFGHDTEALRAASEKIYLNLPNCKDCFCKLIRLTPKNRRLNQVEKLFKQLRKAAWWHKDHPEDFDALHHEAQPLFDKLETLGVSRTFSESVFVFGIKMTPRVILQFEEEE